MSNYVKEQTVGGILRDSYELYKKNFLPLFLIYFLPLFPVTALDQFVRQTYSELAALASIVVLLMTILVLPCITVASSEICLGNRVNVLHSYVRALGKSSRKFFFTYLLLVLIIMVGMLLLIVPGILFSVWYMFTLQVVVLECIYGTRAMKRSKELGKGFYMRNIGISILLYVVMYSIYLLLALPIGGVAGAIIGFTAPHLLGTSLLYLLFAIMDAALMTILAPLPIIGIVLLYYDMRCRKEGYNLKGLGEDIMR